MQADSATGQVTEVLQRFQDGYTARDTSKLDEFMRLFVPGDDGEMIGTGGAVRGGNEWCEGSESVRSLVESDWMYWGDVRIDVGGARITVLGDVAWLATSGELTQTQALDQALEFYVGHMKAKLEDEDADLDERLMEATHFGMRRLRERHKGMGYTWPFVFTAVLVRRDGEWRFHTTHWSMPVD